MKKTHYFVWWKRYALSLSLLFSMNFFGSHLHAQYVHTNGTQIVDENGDEIYFSGMNLGNWLLWEGYLMMGDFNYRTHSQFLESISEAFGNDMTKAKEFEHQWRLNYLTQQGITDLKNLGYNSVRVPFHYNMFWDGNSVKDDGFQYFDRVIEFCRNEGMYVMLDMHAAPGYQNPGDHSDNINSNASQPRETVTFWDGNNVEIASEVWRHIANHYKNEPVIWGYDLINEPVLQVGREYELLGSMVTMRNAIREVDNNHIIIAEGNWWGSEMDKLDWTDSLVQAESGITARWDDNLVYQTHHYSTVVSLLDDRLEICNNLNVPMILGEYGESDYGNISNMTNWCINNDVDYFPWSFKKMSHDKCLWTINPNNSYNQLKSFINSGTTPPADLYDNMIAFCQNNIANGSPGLTWHQGFYDATKPPCELGGAGNLVGDATTSSVSLSWNDNANGEDGWRISRNGNEIATLDPNTTSYVDNGLNSETCYDYVVTAYGSCARNTNITVCTPCDGIQTPYGGTPATIPGIIEAENYDEGCAGLAYSDTNEGNAGAEYRDENVDISSTTDNGVSGFNIGWVAEGEWLAYSVNVATAGTYQLAYRVATPMSTGEIQLRVDENVLSTTTIESTGGWDDWETVHSSNVYLNAGDQIIQIYFSGQEVNLNSFTFSPIGLDNVVPVADAGSNQTLPAGTSTASLDGSNSNDQDNGPSALSYAWTQTAGPDVSITNANTVSPSVSGLSDGNTYGFELTVFDGLYSHSSSVVITVESDNQSFDVKLEAEDYCNMNGIQLEETSDNGGGQNVGWIDQGDYMEYCDVNVPSTGIYTIEYRVASGENGGELSLEYPAGHTVGSVSFNATGNWQSWITVSHDVTLTAGTNDLRITALSSGWNINWFNISFVDTLGNIAPIADAGSDQILPVGSTSTSLNGSGMDADGEPSALFYSWTQTSGPNVEISNATTASPTINGLSDGNSYAFQLIVNDGEDDSEAASVVITVEDEMPLSIKIEAEDYCDMSGIQLEGTSDVGGGQNVGWLDAGDFIEYCDVNIPVTGTYTVQYRIASENGGGEIELEQPSHNILGALTIPSTGGWQNWSTISQEVILTAGLSDLRITVLNGGWNINWIELTLVETSNDPVTGISLSSTNISLVEGGTHQLTGIVSPSYAANRNVSWSTSNSSVATVSASGLVTAQSIGNAIITVTTEDGGYEASCSITVEDLSSSPSSFIIEAEDYVSKSGTVQAEPTEDVDGGENLGYINDGDYTEYNIILPQSGMYKIDYRIASQGANGSISMLLDDNLVSTYEIDVVTGGWQTWTTVTSRVDMNAGSYTLKLLFGGSDFNLNWINVNYIGEDNIAPTTPTISSIETICYSANVVWEESTDNDEVVAYHVYVNGSEYGSVSSNTSMTLSDLSLSTNYNVFVVAEDYAGNLSSASATVSFSTDTECTVSPEVGVVWSSAVRAKDHAWYSNGPFEIPHKLDAQEDLLLVPGTSSSNMTINVDASETYQSMFGVGASFERTTVENMLKLSPATRTELLTQLVHPTEGAGFNLFRIPIGTSDFTGTEWYSYADIQTDDLSNFSIERDKTGVSKTGNPVNSIQVIKEAIAINPNIKFFASPWSPPGWMTSNGIMPAGSFLSEYTDLYAKYLRLFIQAYRAEGIHIEALTLQNEPLHQTGSMPTMNLSPEQHAELAIALQREFDENGIDDCKIWVFDHNPQDLVNFVTPIWGDSAAYDIVDGSAVHDYGGPISEMGRHHDLWPAKNLYFTERSVWGTEGMTRIVDIFRNWSRSYSSWVTMIDQNNEPNEGPFIADPTLFIKEVDNEDGYYAIPELYMIGHFAKHIPIGSVRIMSDEAENQVSNVAWLTPDNKIVMIAVNNGNTDQDFTVVSGGFQFTATLPGQTIATYTWENGLSVNAGARQDMSQAVEKELEASPISLYPNPAISSLTLTGLSDEGAQVTVYSMDGQMVLSQSIESQSEAKFDISRFKNGYYLMKVVTKDGFQNTLRFIKK